MTRSPDGERASFNASRGTKLALGGLTQPLWGAFKRCDDDDDDDYGRVMRIFHPIITAQHRRKRALSVCMRRYMCAAAGWCEATLRCGAAGESYAVWWFSQLRSPANPKLNTTLSPYIFDDGCMFGGECDALRVVRRSSSFTAPIVIAPHEE